LNKGTTKDSFQMAGKTPTHSDKLKTKVKGTFTTEANRFKIGAGHWDSIIPPVYALKKFSK
jgi:hypothetical protein